ncbi:thioredoxin family protein [Aneurinibacillus sp. Ricciae_BoGa-3]|uniref:thioredoxin family protein n=1 Tax=Aneurinibacillus sp. Ricciae_BoGa-3 TaxID=3022697 RepID=UPI00233F9D97|nr:thioredoxin family protein [Aneurinibacillus sp. Ricciae_BoGa-3]WCK52998.1 thioredoxin family protein [Aneurinibacillus sp. Ricciae_BoGa-3]
MKKILSEQQFQNTIVQETFMVMKFSTTWCPDCKRLNIFIDDIVAEHQDKQWYEIDKDEFPQIAEKYDVMGIPSLLVYKNGEKIAHLHSANAKTPDQVREFLNTIL